MAPKEIWVAFLNNPKWTPLVARETRDACISYCWNVDDDMEDLASIEKSYTFKKYILSEETT